MTYEDAIKTLEVTIIEWKYPIGYAEVVALEMAIRALQAKLEAEKNEPLTLDELRDMDGEPVWVQSPGIQEYGRWAIVEGTGGNCLFLHDDFTCHDYGKTWLAYRHKPKEGE